MLCSYENMHLVNLTAAVTMVTEGRTYFHRITLREIGSNGRGITTLILYPFLHLLSYL